MTPTPDTTDLGGLVAALVLTTVASLVVAAAVYVWTGLAMSRLFARLSIQPWRGWVPLLNVAEVLALGGSPRWIALLFLVPIANIYALVMFAIAAHRVNALFGRGVGMTVLAVLLLPVWASVLAWGRATPDPERGRLAEVLGRQTQPTGPLAVPPQPVAPRPDAPAGERAFPPLPGLEHHVPVRAGAPAATPPAAAPAGPPTGSPAPVPPPPSAITPPPGTTGGWPATPSVAAAAAAAAAAPAEPPRTPAAAPGHPPTGQAVSPQAGAPEHPLTTPVEAAPPQPVGGRPATPWAPPRAEQALAAPADPAAPPAHAPAAAPFAPPAGPPVGPPVGSPVAPPVGPPSGPMLTPPAGPPAVPPVGAPLPASPLGAPASAQHHPVEPADQDGLDFADAATIVAYADDEQGDVEATVVVDRTPRRTWRLELDDGDVLTLSGDVVVLGRNPTADGGEQRLAVPDRTRTLSKTHARLARRDGGWTITDLGSTNGVLIVDSAGDEVLIDPHRETPVLGRFVLGEVGMRVTEGSA